ncbi:MAG: heavy-metal-associated domain-containing protein [Candidatus Cloacimonetes bacterium]|nr:heavy-metal-associated domain-containing protein [Candidatus Cloacimonadota bacterium]
MKDLELKVEGMVCQSCVNAITEILGQFRGVEATKIDLESKKVCLSYQIGIVTPQEIIEAIEDGGYDVL